MQFLFAFAYTSLCRTARINSVTNTVKGTIIAWIWTANSNRAMVILTSIVMNTGSSFDKSRIIRAAAMTVARIEFDYSRIVVTRIVRPA